MKVAIAFMAGCSVGSIGVAIFWVIDIYVMTGGGMKIELKNKKICKWMSEETVCFSASLYVDGKRVGTVKNDGRGGAHYYPQIKDRDLLAKAEAYCKTLPPEKYRDFELPMDLELKISMLL